MKKIIVITLLLITIATGAIAASYTFPGVYDTNVAQALRNFFGQTFNLNTSWFIDPVVDVRNYSSIADAVSGIGSTPKTLMISSAQTVTTTVVFPSTLHIIITDTGNITLSGNASIVSNSSLVVLGAIAQVGTGTVTINGPFSAGLHPVFSGFSAGSVTFKLGTIKEIYPEWWGALGTDTGDDSTAINNAIAAASNVAPVMMAGIYRVTSPVKVSKSGVAVLSTPIAYIHVVGAINGVELGDGSGPDRAGNTYIGVWGGVWDCAIVAADGTVLRGIYGRGVREYSFGPNTKIYGLNPARGFTIAGVEMRNSWTQKWTGGLVEYAAGDGYYFNNTAGGNNNIKFFGTQAALNGGKAFNDMGGAGRYYNVYAESNLAGGLSLSGVLGFEIAGGYFETNTGFDIKVDGSSSGGHIAPGYVTHAVSNNHKMIWLLYCNNIHIDSGYFSFYGVTGGSLVYMDIGSSSISAGPLSLTLASGATGSVFAGPDASLVVMKADALGYMFPKGIVKDFNAAGTAYDPIDMTRGLTVNRSAAEYAMTTAIKGSSSINIPIVFSGPTPFSFEIIHAAGTISTNISYKKWTIYGYQNTTQFDLKTAATDTSSGAIAGNLTADLVWDTATTAHIVLGNTNASSIGGQVFIKATGLIVSIN